MSSAVHLSTSLIVSGSHENAITSVLLDGVQCETGMV